NENRKYQRDLEQQVEDRTARLQEALDQLEQSYDDTLEALGSALDLKDAETEGHCQRVTAFCISVAKTMPVPDTYLPILARAACLHHRRLARCHDQRPAVSAGTPDATRPGGNQAMLRQPVRSGGSESFPVHPGAALD